MRCKLCGYQFDEEKASGSCRGCLMSGKCKLIRCPNCGYETPREPEWLKKIFKRRKEDGTDRKS